jgi:WD40 repeat protein
LDGTVIIWDVETGLAEQQLLRRFPGVTSLTFSPDGARLVSGYYDGCICVWSTPTGVLLRMIPNLHDEGFVSVVHFAPIESCSGRSVPRLASLRNSLISLWDVESGEETRTFAGNCFLACSPDGRTVATASNPDAHDVHILDAYSGALRVSIGDQREATIAASFLVDGSKLALRSYDGTCKVRERESPLLTTYWYEST